MELYTDDDKLFEAEVKKARKFIADAVEDGWDHYATYNHESIDTACTMSKDGYIISFVLRPKKKDGMNNICNVHGWCPRGIALSVPPQYNWNDLEKATRVCGHCSRSDMDTVKVGFANRVCIECEPTVKPIIESPGWNN